MKCCVYSALCCAPLFFSATVVADSNHPVRLDTVSVTAVYRESRIEDIAGSVSVLTEDQADFAASMNGAEDITRLLTGVQAAVANGSQIVFQIRGIGAVDHQALTPGAAAVYQNGVFLATNVQTGQMLYDLDRIEVLKGPQGTLYGRNASSGAIHFLSRVAGSDSADYLQASFGRFDRTDLGFGLERSVDDQTDLRIAGRALFQDPALQNVETNAALTGYPSDAGGRRAEGGLRLSLSRKNVLGGDLLAIAHAEIDRGINPTPRNDSLSLGDHEISSEGTGLQDTETEFYGASVKWMSDDGLWNISALTALEGYSQFYGFDFDGTPAPFGNTDLNANLSYDRDYVQVSEEILFQRGFGRGHSLIGFHGSADWFEQDYLIWCGALDQDRRTGTCPYVGAPGRVGPDPASDDRAMSLLTKIRQDRTTLATFTHNEIELTDKLMAVIGVRVTYERLEGSGTGEHIFEDGTIAYNNRNGAGLAMGEAVIEDTRPSGNLALRYRWTSAGTLYGTISNGFKSGGFNGEVQNDATHWSQDGLFDAETVTSYEIGFKSDRSEAFNWSLAAFYQDYDAPQARIFVSFDLPDGSSIVSNSLSNLDEARVYGLEADIDWSPWSGVTLSGGLTALESEIRQRNDPGGNSDLFDGNPLPFASEVSARLQARYERTLSKGDRLSASLAAKHNGGFFLDAEGREDRRQGAYTLLDANVSLRLKESGLTLGLWGVNLLNEDYAVSGYGFIGYNTFRSEPATYGIRLRYDFPKP